MLVDGVVERARAVLAELGGTGVLETQVLHRLESAKGMPVAVACSGGPDSVALAFVLVGLHDGPVTLLHFNHGLRAEASDGDEHFVRELATRLGCDFRSARWENPSKQNEVAAREARLAFLHRWEHSLIFFGQHADDAAETLLMRLARGSSIEGLSAPHPVVEYGQHLHLRPLLKLRKATIVAALERLGIAYRTDASNATGDYLRNRIRNELLPLWQSLEPQRDVVGGILASRDKLRTLDRAEQTEGGAVEADAVTSQWSSVGLPMGTTVFLPGGLSVSAQRVSMPTLAFVRQHSNPARRVWVSDSQHLCLRRWEAGQRYTPWGAPGSRKIKNILNENANELAPQMRAALPLVCAHNQPLWLPFARISSTAQVDFQEKFAIELRFERKPSTVDNDA